MGNGELGRVGGVAFAWYERLSAREKRIYDASAKVREVVVPKVEGLRGVVAELARGLEAEDRGAVEGASARLACGLCDQLGVARPIVRVKSKRPKSAGGELHGLFEQEDGEPAVLTLWMRTAERRDVVAFKTFLRTLLHEVLHHLDYAYFRFKDSMHTEGFYARESSLLVQLVPDAAAFARPKRAKAPAPAPTKAAKREPSKAAAPKAVQLGLFD